VTSTESGQVDGQDWVDDDMGKARMAMETNKRQSPGFVEGKHKLLVQHTTNTKHKNQHKYNNYK
jgi:hypothetical protein